MGSLVNSQLVKTTATISLATATFSDWSVFNASWTPIRRSAGGSTIVNPVPINSGVSQTYSGAGASRLVRWDNGAGNLSGGPIDNGIYVDGGTNFLAHSGYRIQFPADTTSREALVFLELFSCTAWISASLSDGSATPLTLTSTAVPNFVLRSFTYAFRYTANSPGQTLTIDVTCETDTGASTFANVTLQAAAVSIGAAGSVTVVPLHMLLGVGS
jgi:hypothetical protein